MSLADLLSIEFVASPIREHLAGRKSRRGSSGSINIDCPLCPMRRESGFGRDTRQRCGIWITGGSVGVKCFNCVFKARFDAGGLLSNNMQRFMEALGIAPMQVRRLALQAATIQRMVGECAQDLPAAPAAKTEFPPQDLPKGARSLRDWAERGCEDPDFVAVCAYLLSRGDDITQATTYYWTPEAGKHALHRRLIIPYLHDGRIVGWTGRAVDADVPSKYWNAVPSGLLFNTRAITAPKRRYLIVIEGIFDALALDGVAVGSNSLSPQQVQWLNNSGKEIIVLPDRDHAGQNLIDVAMQHDWAVAFPRLNGTGRHNWWDGDVKDAAEATQRYGRLYTLRSVLENKVTSKIMITQLRKRFA